MSFTSAQCVLPQNVGTCTDGETTKQFGSLSEAVSFDAFGIVAALECSTMGRTVLADFTAATLDVTKEWAAAREFLSGDATGNPSLADADVLGATADGAVAALTCLDQAVSNDLGGRLGFIHVAPGLATELLSASAIYREGRTWYTASGNIVVISPGYDGRGPGGDTPDLGESMFMYATGEVYAATGQRDTLEAVERGQNTLQSLVEDAALVVFDPCFNVAIDTGVAFCDLDVNS